jgi:hypothetical protein
MNTWTSIGLRMNRRLWRLYRRVTGPDKSSQGLVTLEPAINLSSETVVQVWECSDHRGRSNLPAELKQGRRP